MENIHSQARKYWRWGAEFIDSTQNPYMKDETLLRLVADKLKSKAESLKGSPLATICYKHSSKIYQNLLEHKLYN